MRSTAPPALQLALRCLRAQLHPLSALRRYMRSTAPPALQLALRCLRAQLHPLGALRRYVLLIRLDARGLDDLAPLFDLGPDLRRELFRAARVDVNAEACHTLLRV